ncbi:hypothetical protein [Micromonospora tarensis]|uniref:Uncharacterized protein n=1 Tax=Micromonospora tarensis TaxID=2806100 RepID=A0ABS1Y9S6_9ACTN|nr:hypothetical protein [Micromonospora tarensis]MBM0274149.1 hypothetical protein [Micromonospora tarensis]
MRGLLIAFSAGVLVGVLVTWEAARRWERAAWAWSWAWSWVVEAAWLAGQAAGWIAMVLLTLTVAGAVIWVAL